MGGELEGGDNATMKVGGSPGEFCFMNKGLSVRRPTLQGWIPAFAGMTVLRQVNTGHELSYS